MRIHLVIILLLLPGFTVTSFAGQGQVLLEAGVNLKYIANDSDPMLGDSWVDVGFDDSNWTAGVYGIGFDASSGKNLLETIVPSSTRSIYTRATFEITNLAAIDTMAFGADYDDAVVVWINGVEVFRSEEMPAGPPLWNATTAYRESSNGSTPDYSPLADITQTAIPVLTAGTNTLAVAVYNSSPTSNDLILVPQLSINGFELGRTPYLQQGSASSMRVKWRTTISTNSVVHYGPSPGSLTSSVTVPGNRWDHDVLLSGLQADTLYYYAVGNDQEVLAGDDLEHYFITAPQSGVSKPTRVWVLGDSGTGNSGATAVANAYRNYPGSGQTDLWLMLGDNAYPDGSDNEHQAAVFDIYPDFLRKSVLWSAFGNHDAHSASSATQSGPYYDIFSFPVAGESGGVPSATEAYYSFDYGNIHFVSLDTYDSSMAPGDAMLLWLADDLGATTLDWTIVLLHHPPYSKGSHNSDVASSQIEVRESVLPILEAAGVDLVMAGHSHSYERSYLLNGHYGTSASLTSAMQVDNGDGREDGDGAYKAIFNEDAPYLGTVYITAGSSGKTASGPLDHPVMLHASLEELGSVVLDIDNLRLDAYFLQGDGSVGDYFSIIKNPDNCPGEINPQQTDTDADGVGDACDADDDGDGLTDVFELSIGTNPLLADSDADGVSDYDEVFFDGDAAYTPGQDTDPLNPDTDNDGLSDLDDNDPLVPTLASGDIAPSGSPDGVVDLLDYWLMQRIVLGLESADPNTIVRGDVYPPSAPDGKLSISDLRQLQQYLPGFQ